MHYNPHPLFNEENLTRYLENKKEKIIEEIRSEQEDYLLTVGSQQYINYMKSKYELDKIELKESYVVPKEEMINANDIPGMIYKVYFDKSYPKEVFYFHVPFIGDGNLLKYRPSRSILTSPRAFIRNNEIVVRFIQFRDDITDVNREYESFINRLTNMLSYLNNDLQSYNDGLEQFISQSFNTRKDQILIRRKQYSNLIVPIKKSENVSDTFTIPSPQIKKKISVKPVQTTKNYSPDPTIDEKTFLDILTIINDMGKEFERKPSVYSSKGEEDLRDHFLMMLEPNFEGSATGETFNKTGKTDILLRHEGTNVFVGECKFWSGEKGFLRTIDQLLGYLTWRDSKTAVIMFVRNKDFSNVVKNAKESIESHPNFIKHDKDYDQSWFNYTFHINDDKNKEIRLALMLYHTPK